jgi:iron complex outermembrane receptor protein
MLNTKYFCRLAFLLLALSTAVFAQTGGKISGRVIFAGNSSPLSGASVQIVQLKRSVATSDNGDYEFNGIPAGRYTILVRQDGFSSAARSIVLSEGGSVSADFALQVTGVHEQVTVTASGETQAVFDAIEPAVAIDSNKILERGGLALGDTLDREPGIAKRTATPASSRPVIRGFDGDRILIAEDGIRDGSIAAFSENHAEPVDLISVDRVEVVRGPATLLYGSNAIGGVVNTISRNENDFHRGLSGYFSTIGGFNNKQAAVSGGLDYGIKNWMLWWNGSGQRTGDYKAGGDFGRVDHTFKRLTNGVGGIGYFGEKGFFHATYDYYQNRFGIPIDLEEDPPKERTIRSYRSNYKVSGGLQNLDSFIESMKFTFDFSNYRQRESEIELDEEDMGGPEEDETAILFRNKLLAYRGVFNQRRYRSLSGTFGFDGYRRNYSANGEETLIHGNVVQNSFAVFGLEQVALERVIFQVGARVENNRYRPEDTALSRRDLTGFSGAAGLRVALWDGGAFVANYSHASRLPALEELYNNGPHDDTLSFEIGDPNLKIERSDGIDLSLRHQKGRLRAEANFFYYNIKNFVFLEPTDEIDKDTDLPIAFYVQGDSRFVGTEANLNVKAHKFLDMTGGIDYVNAELKSGVPLPRIPPLRSRLGLDAHYKYLSVRPELVLASKQDNTFTDETPTAGYGVFNIAGSYVIPGKHYTNVISVNAYNLTDKLYFNHVSFIKDISPEIGRGIRFGYTIRFF